MKQARKKRQPRVNTITITYRPGRTRRFYCTEEYHTLKDGDHATMCYEDHNFRNTQLVCDAHWEAHQESHLMRKLGGGTVA